MQMSMLITFTIALVFKMLFETSCLSTLVMLYRYFYYTGYIANATRYEKSSCELWREHNANGMLFGIRGASPISSPIFFCFNFPRIHRRFRILWKLNDYKCIATK